MKRVSAVIAITSTFTFAFTGALATLSSSARAEGSNDVAVAEALFTQGKDLMAQGRFDQACPKLAESNRLDTGIGTMLYLADCYEKSGKNASAWGVFKEAASQAQKQGDTREKLARDRATALEPSLAKMTIVVPPANRADGLTVTKDGADVGAPQWDVALPIDPGAHRIVASAPGRASWSTTVDVPAGASFSRVEVPALKMADASPPPQRPPANDTSRMPEEHDGSGQRTVGIVLAAAGVVGIGIGAGFGLAAKSKADDAKPFCTGNVCDQPGLDDRSSARSQANVSTGAFIAGGVLLVAGAVVYVVAPKAAAKSAFVNTSGGGFRWSF